MNINLNITVTKENARTAEAGRAEKTHIKSNYISETLLHEFLMWLAYRGSVTILDICDAGYRLDVFFQIKKELHRKGWILNKRTVNGIARYSLGGRK